MHSQMLAVLNTDLWYVCLLSFLARCRADCEKPVLELVEKERLLTTVLTSFLERHLKILLNTQVCCLPNMLLKHKGLTTTTACVCAHVHVIACTCIIVCVTDCQYMTEINVSLCLESNCKEVCIVFNCNYQEVHIVCNCFFLFILPLKVVSM